MMPMPMPAALPKRQRAAFSIGVLLFGTLAISPATAQSVEAFYKGKTVTAIVGSGAGDGYDAAMRLLARHITRHIPGEPKIVAQNMPAASRIAALNHVYNIAPRDGTVISGAANTMPFDPLFDGPAARSRGAHEGAVEARRRDLT